MSDPFVGEVRLFAFARVPTGWLACNGAALRISDYQTLFHLIGTQYGGDGRTTFCAPDLRGRIPLNQGAGPALKQRVIGEVAGEEDHTLLVTEIPSHGHALLSTTNTGTTATPGTTVHLATSNVATSELYAPIGGVTGSVAMAASITGTGGNQAHSNMMPTLTGNYCMAYAGIFPPDS